MSIVIKNKKKSIIIKNKNYLNIFNLNKCQYKLFYINMY